MFLFYFFLRSLPADETTIAIAFARVPDILIIFVLSPLARHNIVVRVRRPLLISTKIRRHSYVASKRYLLFRISSCLVRTKRFSPRAFLVPPA